MDQLLHCSDIIKEYKDKSGSTLRVLDGVSMGINSGSTIAIVGASGSGKSTLLHILGGLDKPTSGQVFYKNNLISTMNADKLAAFRNKNLGFVFQFHHLLPEFSAIENVMMPALIANKNDKSTHEYAMSLLSSFGLEDRAQHRPSELSGGEQQRVAVARALVNKPDVILADEPTGNLDEKSTTTLLDLLFNEVKTKNLTLVMVTHDQSIAASCDFLYKLENGRFNQHL